MSCIHCSCGKPVFHGDKAGQGELLVMVYHVMFNIYTIVIIIVIIMTLVMVFSVVYAICKRLH